jgi:hypothetical protein
MTPESAPTVAREPEGDPTVVRQPAGDPTAVRDPAGDPTAVREPATAEPGLRALGRAALDGDAGPDPAEASPAAGASTHSGANAPAPADAAGQERPAFDLGRVAWLVTVLACLLATAILGLDGYAGYAGVTLAVALSAAINLL